MDFAAHMGLRERVKFLGMVPHEEMPTVFREADAFVFTSLRDSSGAVVIEAMAWGLPVIVPDHQGVGTFVPEGAGIKFPVESPERTVRYLAEAIELVASRPDLREKMARESWSFAQTERWDRRAERMLSLYEKLVTEERTN
jgi:glycosyltransferase involved in cell wall biosynthesis